ncbi:cell division protein ZapE [Candidatus Albibeggiatoa sp. nov. BB20]|uniref:cell division protein ZapE n=1 Tax=Candidatus Albibeggiatoa sp. nov. BB20 TaxID=3162723 RepID=UPI0033656C92
MTPQQIYQAALATGDFCEDAAQAKAVDHTQRLYEDLLNALHEPKVQMADLWLKLWKRKTNSKQQTIKGLYLWGGVGRGKTYLVDNFYHTLPFNNKLRLHFHRFMQQVHDELKQLKDIQNPLVKVAQHFAERTKILCLDEFHVLDIADAMLLGGLLQELFEQGVTLVTTSNVHPDDLYKGGLQRDRFLPAIDLLKNSTHVINVDNGVDYRLRALEQAEIYHHPLDAAAEHNMRHSFTEIAPDQPVIGGSINLYGRDIPTIQMADGVIWFDFHTLCDVPRGTPDYIEIATCYQTVFVSGVPSMGDAENDLALRFVNLVDEFYDRSVKLIIAAEESADLLYTGKRLEFQYQRTLSRLQEMQSHEYLAREHKLG